MLNMKKKNAITLLALVLTIVIMLLLAAIAIQMTFGENGLVVKSTQAQKEQAKAELYDTAKQSYTRLSLQAIENKMPKPGVEEVLTTEEFTAKYNVVGGNITDKKGTVIDTKEAVLDMLKTKYIVPTSELEEEENTPATPEETTPTPTPTPTPEETTPTPTTPTPIPTPEKTTPQVVWPKVVAGVTIPEEDKDKMILKITTIGAIQLDIRIQDARIHGANPIEIDYGTGEKGQINTRAKKDYNDGVYIVKLKNVSDFLMENRGICFVEILQWGRILEKNEENIIRIPSVSEIHEPEPDRIPIEYSYPKFTEIPEWLFSKKVTSTKISKFDGCIDLRSIPENLFKNNVNVTDFSRMFYACSRLTSIPENLFKNNINATNFSGTFYGCDRLTSIPENLFKNNVNATDFSYTFSRGGTLTSIPENLFKNNVNATDFSYTFEDCYGLTSIPENLFKNNVKVTNFNYTFTDCRGLTSIPENLFKYNINVTDFERTFYHNRSLTSIPENLFKNNVNVTSFKKTFENCYGLTSIPENLFKYNVNVTSFSSTFQDNRSLTSIPENLFKYNTKVIYMEFVFAFCAKLSRIPDGIIQYSEQVRQRGGGVVRIFYQCTTASNYGTIPSYMK